MGGKKYVRSCPDDQEMRLRETLPSAKKFMRWVGRVSTVLEGALEEIPGGAEACC